MKIAGVIPTHNRSDVLPIALDSMSRQKRLPDEVIVVSDVIDEEAEKLTNDFLKSNSMKGQFALNLSGSSAGSSRNAGAALTNADAIAFLDDDDCWHDDYLKEIETAFTDGVDAVVTHMLQFRDGKIAPFHAVAPGLSASDALVVNPGVCGSNIVIRRDVFEKLGGYDETLSNSNDKDFFFRFLDEGFKYSVVARPLSYVNRQDSISRLTNVTPRMLGAFERYWEK